MIQTSQIKASILKSLPDADLIVEDLTGEGKNFAIDAISGQFEGKNKVQQHRIVYEALGENLRREMHAIKILTSAK